MPDQLGQKWRATGPARVLEGQRLSGLPDADAQREYGVRRVISRGYTDGGLGFSVEVFELNLIPGAYGLFTFNRGQLPPNCSEFLQGRYVVRVLRREAGDGDDRQIFEAIKPDLIGGEGELPSLPLHLPETDKIAESEKYAFGPASLARLKNFGDLKGVVSFNAGAEVATADYRNGGAQMNLIIVEYYSPQVAGDGEGRIRDHFNALPQDVKDRLIIKRVGNYVVVMSNIQDMPAAQNIVGQIKYQKEFYWAGRKFTDIPLEYRPPDPLAVEQYTRTVKTMIRSFYWAGIVLLSALLLGFTAGFSLFQWKRYRRRKLGLDTVFSDAGGSLRLNLDDYLLSDNPSDESNKLTRRSK
ncbi:MAG TPA: DUF6599 family protein [Blastocatellia bacterium]|nr:DUF6599 family protein [Blastocatellia bacterium]